jgi:carbon storage regulator CsrA|tara:strand:+ start:1803 stop:1985 length:183 start_codon:yes stop_codon:yes gene_type:complete
MSRLVLTRKTNESVVIHKDNDTVVVLNVNRIDRNQVRLSFEADTDVKIDRSEVFFQDEKN